MLPGMELMACTDLAVPSEVMRHVVKVESSFNPFAIGVVGGRLERQPRNLAEAVSTARMLERGGYNFSLGLAQVNRHNLTAQGLDSYERAFEACPNLRAGARILADCHRRAGEDWGKALSCYYSGNFVTGFRHGYVQKVMSAWQPLMAVAARPLSLVERRAARATSDEASLQARSLLARRIMQEAQQAPSAYAIGQPPQAAAGASVPAVPAAVGVTTAPVPPRIDVAPADVPVVVQRVGATPASGGVSTAKATESLPPRDQAFVF